MGELAVISWNMRGLSSKGDKKKKIRLLENEMFLYSPDPKHPNFPVFFLQEAGELATELASGDGWLAKNYRWHFAAPIGAGNDRCTTGIMIPKQIPGMPKFAEESQSSGVRSYVKAEVQLGGKTVLLASIHAVASKSAAEDGWTFLKACSKSAYFVAGGDLNCTPDCLEAEKLFSERQREAGACYNVHFTEEFTHLSTAPGADEDDGKILDYIMVKGLKVIKTGRGFGSEKRHGERYSDHWPAEFVIEY